MICIRWGGLSRAEVADKMSWALQAAEKLFQAEAKGAL
jgi:hypothetical protein